MNSSHQFDTMIGRLIDDRSRYRLESYLGGGGMGDVFLATDTLLGKLVALKLLKGTLINAKAFSKRFAREVSLSAALKSDHIVQVSDYGMLAEGDPFYVMEYLEGETLGQRLAKQKRLSAQQAIGIIVQVCKGLQVAHEGVEVWQQHTASSKKIKIVHRDLKPENIFLVPTVLGELVKIIDFGIAKIYNDQKIQETNLSVANQFIGTFRYASPEQWESREELDGRSDIYSLGIILYEMLSGTDPFDSNTTESGAISIAFWARAHTQTSPRLLRSQPGCENISQEIEAVVMRCLEKSPDRRFASVADLGRAIIQAAVVNNLPLNIAIPQTTPPNALNITESDTPVNGSLPPTIESVTESVFPRSKSLEIADPTQNAFTSAETIATTPDRTPSRKSLLRKLAVGTAIAALLTGGFHVYRQGQSHNSAADVKPSQLPEQTQKISIGKIMPVLTPVNPIKLSEGRTYIGELGNGKPSGKGILIYLNGTYCEADFSDGQLNGQGVCHIANGDSYEGAFQNDEYNGQGKAKYADKSRYEGGFQNGKWQGEGIYTDAKGKSTKGKWNDGKLIP